MEKINHFVLQKALEMSWEKLERLSTLRIFVLTQPWALLTWRTLQDPKIVMELPWLGSMWISRLLIGQPSPSWVHRTVSVMEPFRPSWMWTSLLQIEKPIVPSWVQWIVSAMMGMNPWHTHPVVMSRMGKLLWQSLKGQWVTTVQTRAVCHGQSAMRCL